MCKWEKWRKEERIQQGEVKTRLRTNNKLHCTMRKILLSLEPHTPVAGITDPEAEAAPPAGQARTVRPHQPHNPQPPSPLLYAGHAAQGQKRGLSSVFPNAALQVIVG